MTPDDLVDPAIDLVRDWLVAAQRSETRDERAVASRLDAITGDPEALRFTMRFVDRVARHRDPRLAAGELRALIEEQGVPAFLGFADRTQLRAARVVSRPMAPVVIPLARRRLRHLVGPMVVDADPDALHRYVRDRQAEGFTVNVNRLGEAVLGADEATHRFDDVLASVADPAIDYVSVKLSSIVDHIDMWSLDATLARVAERLRALFTAADTSTFVNLDMEEYRDLGLTLQAFTDVLAEPELDHVPAGIVVQAYLPDSWDALQALAAWAEQRHARGGADVKVRLVKGANLAMERVDAALHGWVQAPYASKAEVDANYKRCVELLCGGATPGLRAGIASHNLFDVAWALLVARDHGVADRIEIEMLQGIATPQARVVRDASGGLRLYSPVVTAKDFDVAISYLFRRLEENTAPENYLHHAFSLLADSPQFDEEVARFRTAVAERHGVYAGVRRAPAEPADADFSNEPDSDPSLVTTQRWITTVRDLAVQPVRAAVTTDPTDVDDAYARARAAQPGWWALGAEARRATLDRVAGELAARRGELIATMAAEAAKVYAEGDPEVSEAVDFAKWYGHCGLELEHLADVTYAPLGVVAVVPPWNFPVAIPTGGVCAALAAGNAVVFKPSPETPRCAEIVAEACWAAGVPGDVLQFVRTPDDDTGRRLVESADAVIFTGSWETATLFRTWKPELRLFAETSGKNALVITEHADLDLAATDLVRSAFGHSGQKCSAASLGILVGGLYVDERFRAKLVDAARSLAVGDPTVAGPALGPLTVAPSERLQRALTTLDRDERWLLQPQPLDDSGRLWSPGIKDGVMPGSRFHHTECFGPVLGLMRADDLDHAIRLQNSIDFALTGGIHTLDPHESEHWLERVQVGNAYVNRHITGAIVRRQPFGGWKRSCVGGGAKAGGFDYLLQLGTWRSERLPADAGDPLAVAAVSDDHWWRTHYGIEHDPSALFCESNVLRYRPRPHVLIRQSRDARSADLARAVAAASRAGVTPEVSRASTESDQALIDRKPWRRFGRVRVIGSVGPELRQALIDAEVDLVDEPVTSSGRLELRHYLREQAVSTTLHRFGNLVR